MDNYSSEPTEDDIMLSIWREAGRDSEGITIPCESPSNAIRLRFALYNAIKPIKTGKRQADAPLLHGIATCSLSFTADKSGLIVRKKTATLLGKTLVAALKDKPIQSMEEALLMESFSRIQAAVAEEALPQPEPALPSAAFNYGARER